MINLSVAEAKSRFSELISRAASGERFIIERRLRPVAVVLGAADLAQLERSADLARRLALAMGQHPELVQRIEAGEVHPAMAAFGLWADETDLDDLAGEIAANRRRQTARSAPAL
jgi:prevent-host-death family protein